MRTKTARVRASKSLHSREEDNVQPAHTQINRIINWVKFSDGKAQVARMLRKAQCRLWDASREASMRKSLIEAEP